MGSDFQFRYRRVRNQTAFFKQSGMYHYQFLETKASNPAQLMSVVCSGHTTSLLFRLVAISGRSFA